MAINMKRLLTVLLLCTLIFPLAACSKKEPLNSEVSNESSSSGEQTSSPQIQAINRMLGSGVDRTKGRTNILKGITYKPSREAGDNGSYTDAEHKMLTDGIFAESFNSYSWAGYTGSGTVTVTFDLGKEVENIADIEIGCLRQIEYGIGLPGYTEVYASDDGKSYSKLGKLIKPDDVSESQKYTYVFHLQGVIKTRYIQVKFSNPEKGFVFVDEIAAYTYDGGGTEVRQIKDYYQSFKPNSDTVYWDEKDADYTQKQNLALGKKVSVVSFSSFNSTNANDKQNSLPDNGILTDGKYSEYASWDRTDVFRFTQGDGRQVIIDLEKVSAVSEVKGDLLQQSEWGIKPPSAIGVSVSVNGTDWQGVSTAEIKAENSESIMMIKFSADLKKVYRARYVRLQFLVNPFAAFSEIEVIGTKKIPADAVVPDPKAVVTRLSDRYITPGEFGGVNNIFCNPVCRGDGTTYDESAMITHDEFLKYVGYYEGEKLTDTFFDTFLFSPCSNFTNDADKITLKGWKFYVDSQFVAERNINALNAAVKTVGDGLGKNDLKVNVLFLILRTNPKKADGSVNTFGDIDGDGKDDSFDKIENRRKALKWMVDTQLKKYKDAGLDRLNLTGFYWQEEHIVTDDPQDIELIQWTADYVHKLGYKFMWIPPRSGERRRRGS
jgi:predicted small lipoprotein YifL